MATIKYSKFIQTGRVTVSATSGTTVPFPANFDNIPKIVATSYGTSAGTITISSASTASFTLTTETAGTVDWIAIYQSL